MDCGRPGSRSPTSRKTITGDGRFTSTAALIWKRATVVLSKEYCNFDTSQLPRCDAGFASNFSNLTIARRKKDQGIREPSDIGGRVAVSLNSSEVISQIAEIPDMVLPERLGECPRCKKEKH
jgi:hypothetical protein